VKAPRFRIAWIMVAVAIAGINFAALRAGRERGAGLPGVFILVGALPMANVLVVGMLIARKRSGSRPFFLGFEVFGAFSLTLYILAATCFRIEDGPLERYLFLVLGPLNPVIRPYGGFRSQRNRVVCGHCHARRSATRLRRDWWFSQSQIQKHRHSTLIGCIRGLFQFSVPLLLMGPFRAFARDHGPGRYDVDGR
jgi:hypothetical protein